MAEKEYIDLYECRDDFYATVLDILSEDNTNDRANQIIDAFDCLPAADVAPVRHGRWVKEKPDVLIHWHCSVCKNCYYLEEPNANYCPNCGAKMDGGEEK